MKKLLLIIIFITSIRTVYGDNGYMGTGNCSSSNCHGNVTAKNSNNVLQNEYITWLKHDKHSQAFKTLTTEESKIIAKHLNISAPEKDTLCLNCHATISKNAKFNNNQKFNPEDGVSCESCHGAAKNWIESHYSKAITHQENVAHGMYDTADLNKRNQLCTSCHYGNNDQFVNHRLIGAGHPRLTFEADTFETIMPRHWRIDDDYIKRKQVYNSINSWISGQFNLSQETLNKISSPKRAKNGAYHEFSIFYCYSCHHSLSPNQWKTRNYFGNPGDPTLNLSSLLVLNIILKATESNKAKEFENLINDLNHNFKENNVGQTILAISTFLKRNQDMFTQQTYSDATCRAILKELVSFAANVQFLQYEVAEQILMGISSILSSSEVLEIKYRKDVDKLYNALKNEKEFIAENFTAGAKVLNSKLK